MIIAVARVLSMKASLLPVLVPLSGRCGRVGERNRSLRRPHTWGPDAIGPMLRGASHPGERRCPDRAQSLNVQKGDLSQLPNNFLCFPRIASMARVAFAQA